jgi:hypothetical protein
MRAPYQEGAPGQPRRQGLASYDVVPSGPQPPHPTEALAALLDAGKRSEEIAAAYE